MAVSMNFATAIMTFTAKGSVPNGLPSMITLTADSFSSEEEFLGEPQPDKDRAKWFPSNDGQDGQYIDNFSIAGKRDLTIFDGPNTLPTAPGQSSQGADDLIAWAQANPSPLFDFFFSYQRSDQDATQIRTHRHYNCKIYNHPGRAMNNDIYVVKFTLHYGRLQTVDALGNPVV